MDFIEYHDNNAAVAARSKGRDGGTMNQTPLLQMLRTARKWGATLLLTSLMATGFTWEWDPHAVAGVTTGANPALQAPPASPAAPASTAIGEPPRGLYFAKKAYVPRPLPTFAQTQPLLPSPVYDEHPGYVEMYWKAWELAFRNFHEPEPESGFVSQFIDASFNENIFLWDTCFMTLFCNVAHPLVPGIESLDNFYARQHADGEICREINRTTGGDFIPWRNEVGRGLYSAWGYDDKHPASAVIIYRDRMAPRTPPQLTLDALNNPLAAWVEMESYRMTGDKARLGLVYPPLAKYFEALQEYLRQGNGLYMTDWASMDNSTRNGWLRGGGCGVDISCEMALFAREMAAMARTLGRDRDAGRFDAEAVGISAAVNRLLWDPATRFYYDQTAGGRRTPVKTVAAYWALLAGVASPEQADALALELANPATFGRLHQVPTLAADQPGYDPRGGYWRGAVWAPTNTMVIRGLERYGQHELARALALQHLDAMAQVFRSTGTIWENYAPDAIAPGKPAKKDFVGWSGIGPILYLIEYGIGLKANAVDNELSWELRSAGRVGCARYRFNGHVVDLLAEPSADGKTRRIAVRSDGAFMLKVNAGKREQRFEVAKGEASLRLALE